MKTQGTNCILSKRGGVVIKDEERYRDQRKIGTVEDLILGRDGIVQADKLRMGKERSNEPNSTSTHWNCLAIGRIYMLPYDSTPKPRHSGPKGIQWQPHAVAFETRTLMLIMLIKETQEHGTVLFIEFQINRVCNSSVFLSWRKTAECVRDC